MQPTRFFAAALAAAAISSPAAAAIVVDGNIDEWLANKTTWAVANAGIHATVEDQTGGLGAYLNPGYGGQAYDAEALFATIADSRLYIALATGHNPLTATGGNNYGAGDFAIDFGRNGSYELGINFFRASANAKENFGQMGGVYRVGEWYYGLWQSPGNYNPANPDRSNPTAIKSGVKLGNAQFAYTTVGATGYGSYAADRHYFYEMSIDLALLQAAGWDGSAFDIHWTELCANDAIVVDPDRYVPEPASLALVVGGLFGLATARRRAEAVRSA